MKHKHSEKHGKISAIIAICSLIFASIGASLYRQNPIDDPATGNQASGNLSVAIFFGCIFIICSLVSLSRFLKNRNKKVEDVAKAISEGKRNDISSTIDIDLNEEMHLIAELRQRFADSIDECADDIDNLDIALETYPNPNLPLHIEMEDVISACKKHIADSKEIVQELESAIMRVCSNSRFTESQYEALQELDDYLVITRDALVSTCNSIGLLADNIRQLRIPDFKVAKPQGRLSATLKEMCFVYKSIIGTYANLSKKCKMGLRMATVVENEEDVEQYSDYIDYLDDVVINGHQFEYYCADILRKNSFQNVVVTKGSGDQGVDVTADKDGIRYAFQCKYYSTPLGNKPVQEVYAGKAIYNCHVGVVVTNSTFTKGAIEAADKTGVLLWDGNKLRSML